MHTLLEEIKRMKAIADTGLLYATTGYEKERYVELQEIAFRLLNQITDHPVEELKVLFTVSEDYPTVKVDLRGVVLSTDKKILLVKESSDGKWSLPGGWADIGFTPAEGIAKEIKEETGLHVFPKNLIAVFDKRKHAHPPQPFYVYKLVIFCESISSNIQKGFDVLDVGYFPIDNLPELSEERILKSQIELVFGKITRKDFETYFD